MIKRLILIAAAVAVSVPATAQVRVKPYVKKDGTYVEGHVRTKPNNTTLDNWSTKPNVNPSNGKQGTVDPWKPKPLPTYKPG